MIDTANGQNNPFDAEYNFDFLDNYLSQVLSPVVEQSANQSESDAETLDDATSPDEEVDSNNEIESMEDVNTEMLLADDDPDEYAKFFTPQGSATSQIGGNLRFKDGTGNNGLKAPVLDILDGLSSVAGEVVVTSGKRSAAQNASAKGVKGSYHLSGDAVDIRPTAKINAYLSSAEGRKYISEKGYEVIDERKRAGHGAHWHLEPSSRQFGGGVPVANTKEEQYLGLNDGTLDELILPLKGTNTIRGLDSGRPVTVTDSKGNSKTLYGPNDTTRMKGELHERKYQVGGKTYKGNQQGFDKNTVYVDKGKGKMYFYDEQGNFQEREVLTGKNRKGHLLNPGYISTADDQSDSVKITPIGMWPLSDMENIYGSAGLSFEGGNGIALHHTYDEAYRNQFYYNNNVEDNAQSYGCVNCNKADADRVSKLYANKQAYVYDSNLSNEQNQKYTAVNDLIRKDNSLYGTLSKTFDKSKVVSYRQDKSGKLYNGNRVFDPSTDTLSSPETNMSPVVITNGKRYIAPGNINKNSKTIPENINKSSKTIEGSIVDFLVNEGVDYSKKNRAKIAEKLGMKNYNYTAEQNIQLLNHLKNNPNILNDFR